MEDRLFLLWIYNRLINIHNENAQFDYMHKLKSIIDGMYDTSNYSDNTCNNKKQQSNWSYQ